MASSKPASIHRKKPLSTRAKARLQRMRRDPFGRLALAVQTYLQSIGWSVVVVGAPQVRGYCEEGRLTVSHFEFGVRFTGGRTRTVAAGEPWTKGPNGKQ